MISIVLLFSISCEKAQNENAIEYEIISGACGTISFVDNIGADLSTALDSLVKIRESFIENDYIIMEVDMEIGFYDNTREFKGIKFISVSNQTLIFSMSDVLDSNGNYYFINWCPD